MTMDVAQTKRNTWQKVTSYLFSDISSSEASAYFVDAGVFNANGISTLLRIDAILGFVLQTREGVNVNVNDLTGSD